MDETVSSYRQKVINNETLPIPNAKDKICVTKNFD